MPKFKKLDLPGCQVIKSKSGLFNPNARTQHLYIHDSEEIPSLKWRFVGKLARHIAYRHLAYIDRSKPENKIVSYNELPQLNIESSGTGLNFEYLISSSGNITAESFLNTINPASDNYVNRANGIMLSVKFSTGSVFDCEKFDFLKTGSGFRYISLMKLMNKWWVVLDYCDSGLRDVQSLRNNLEECKRRNDNKEIFGQAHAASIVIEPFLNLIPD